MKTLLTSGRRRGPQAAVPFLILLVIAAVLAFLAGFALFWNVGSRVAGGGVDFGFPDFARTESTPQVEAPHPAAARYPVTVAFDPIKYRDARYVPVKGIHVSSWVAGSQELLAKQLALCDRTEINAIVVEVKDDLGHLAYDTDVPLAEELGLEDPRIKDIDAFIAALNEHGVIPIARVVSFKDPLLASKRPEWGVQHRNGGLWEDYKGISFVNPYDERVWEYLVDVAEDAAAKGFREIQFDYVRFPSDGKISDTVYPGKDRPMEDAIADFLEYARGRLEKRGVWVSADVFGLTVHVKDDLGIGQKVEKVARHVDIVSPMIYPSHYYAGSYNLKDPNSSPYEVIRFAMLDSGRRLSGSGAVVRPWLQDFSLDGVAYGPDEVRAQIRAVEELGYTEWILWDPSVTYTEAALNPE